MASALRQHVAALIKRGAAVVRTPSQFLWPTVACRKPELSLRVNWHVRELSSVRKHHGNIHNNDDNNGSNNNNDINEIPKHPVQLIGPTGSVVRDSERGGYFKVRVIDMSGTNLGILGLREAEKLAYAQQKHLTVVHAAKPGPPQEGVVPVVKFSEQLDEELIEIKKKSESAAKAKEEYKKRKQELKRQADAKKKTVMETRKIRFTSKTEIGDMKTKERSIRKHLEKGCRVHCFVLLKPKDLENVSSRPEELLQNLGATLVKDEVATILNPPVRKGINVTMLLAPFQGTRD